MPCVQLLQRCCGFVQMELGTYPEPIQAVMQKLLAAASPSAPVLMHWRYSLMSLAVFLFIMPPVDAASAKVCTFLPQHGRARDGHRLWCFLLSLCGCHIKRVSPWLQQPCGNWLDQIMALLLSLAKDVMVCTDCTCSPWPQLVAGGNVPQDLPDACNYVGL